MALSLIIDRNANDVAYYKQQRDKINDPNKGWSSLSNAEKAEWLAANLKGGYWYTDLNRVGQVVSFLASELNSYGYTVQANPKTDWSAADFAIAPLIESYLNDLKNLKAGFYGTTPLPVAMVAITYIDVNNIELLLTEIYEYITLMEQGFRCSGTYACGQGVILP